MGDLEFFGGLDTGGESFDAAAFERFKERMKRAAAQLKAKQKTEQKQKKTEEIKLGSIGSIVRYDEFLKECLYGTKFKR